MTYFFHPKKKGEGKNSWPKLSTKKAGRRDGEVQRRLLGNRGRKGLLLEGLKKAWTPELLNPQERGGKDNNSLRRREEQKRVAGG